MTEIIEDDGTEGLEPDHWAGVHRFYDPHPRQELDKLKAEFFARGGVATWLPPVVVTSRKHDLYMPDAVKRYESKRNATQKATDGPYVKMIGDWLDNMEPTSRRHMSIALGISDQLICRIVGAYFKDDPRAECYQRKDAGLLEKQQEEEDQRNRAIIELCLEQGIRGGAALEAATGMSYVVISRIAKKYKINTRRISRKDIEAAQSKRTPA